MLPTRLLGSLLEHQTASRADKKRPHNIYQNDTHQNDTHQNKVSHLSNGSDEGLTFCFVRYHSA